MQLLEAGIDRIHDSTEFRRYLEFSASFHRYSASNQLLIYMQRPDATVVAGFNDWKKRGRYVRQGERAIKIVAPLVKKDVDPNTGEIVERPRGYKIVNVFDVASTDGTPLPDGPRPQDIESATETGHRLFLANWDYLASKGIPLRREAVPGSPRAKGAYVPARPGVEERIYVRPDMAIDTQAKTLAHESAHYLADHRFGVDREAMELVAESTAFVTAHRFGVDTSDYSFDYIIHWSQDRDLFKQQLGEIQTLSKALITGIEGFYKHEPAATEPVDLPHAQSVVLFEGRPQRPPSPDELRR